jgi:hypothetical protein
MRFVIEHEPALIPSPDADIGDDRRNTARRYRGCDDGVITRDKFGPAFRKEQGATHVANFISRAEERELNSIDTVCCGCLYDTNTHRRALNSFRTCESKRYALNRAIRLAFLAK